MTIFFTNILVPLPLCYSFCAGSALAADGGPQACQSTSTK